METVHVDRRPSEGLLYTPGTRTHKKKCMADKDGTLPPPCKLPPLQSPPPTRETVTSMFF